MPSSDYPNRNTVTILDFVTDVEFNSTWQNLSDTGKLTMPKKIYFKDQYGNTITWEGKNIISSINGTSPMILRGDKISIDLGYDYYTIKNGKEKPNSEINNVFNGYVSNVDNKLPIEIQFEDNMWLLKQVQAENKTFKNDLYSVETMLKEMLVGTPFTVKQYIGGSLLKTNIGDFTTKNETIAQVLDRLQKDFRMESYFIDNVLYCGPIVYYPENMKEVVFKFQYNIIEDELLYKRKDDVRIGVAAHAYTPQKIGTNKDGTHKYRTDRVEYFGYFEKGELIVVPVEKKPKAFDGEIRTINMLRMPESQIKEFITKELNRITYDGWRGKFTTFGLPLVKHGYIVHLIDEVIPERTGKYMVKGVRTTFGMDGFRQEVTLDLRIDNVSQDKINSGL